MPAPRLSAAVAPLLRFVAWVFSPAAPGLDLLLGLVGGAWLAMQVLRPDVFDHGSFTGLQWAPDGFWIAYVAVTVFLHVVGLLALDLVALRVAAGLGSAWYWLLVSLSLTRTGIVPGTWTYGIIGAVGLLGAIYISGRATRAA